MLHKLILTIRSLLFYAGHYSIIVLFSLIGIALRPFSLTSRLKFMRFGVKLCLAWLRITCNITYRIHGFSKLNPEQPSIILSRHESTWEALAFHAIFPLQINLVKKELKKIPFFGFILTTINSIMIDRNKGFNAIKKIKLEGKKAIKDGFWVVIFPGGTRVLPGESSNINSGGAILAKQENVPIYLITHNAGTVWPKGTFIKQPGIIDLHINVIEQPEVKDISTINRETEEWFQSKQHLTLNTCIASEEIVYPITDP